MDKGEEKRRVRRRRRRRTRGRGAVCNVEVGEKDATCGILANEAFL